jgi:Carboxypeptidase regulatory-like domain
MLNFTPIRSACACLLIAAGTLFGAIQAFAQAQATTGQIAGVARDSAGAAVPNATIKVTNTQTGFSQTAISGADGLYRFVLLPPGVYNLTAEAANFAQTEFKEIPVTVGQITDLNITLGVGSVSETVTVTADSLQTTAIQPDALFNQKSIDNLPINGRRFQDFVQHPD